MCVHYVLIYVLPISCTVRNGLYDLPSGRVRALLHGGQGGRQGRLPPAGERAADDEEPRDDEGGHDGLPQVARRPQDVPQAPGDLLHLHPRPHGR